MLLEEGWLGADLEHRTLLKGCDVGTRQPDLLVQEEGIGTVPRPLDKPLERLSQLGLSSKKAGCTPLQQGVIGHINELGMETTEPMNLLLLKCPPCLQSLLIINVVV